MKLLTEEMVQDALKQLGVTEEQLEAESPDLSSKIMEHYDCRISDRWEEQDLYIYEESTADGYSAYICTHNPNSICINEDVYQYDQNTEVINRFEEAIRNGQSVYCDDEDFIEQVCDNMINTFLDDVRADVEMEFHNKGYSWPVKVPQLLQTAWETISNHNADNKYKNLLEQISTAIDQLNIKNDN